VLHARGQTDRAVAESIGGWIRTDSPVLRLVDCGSGNGNLLSRILSAGELPIECHIVIVEPDLTAAASARATLSGAGYGNVTSTSSLDAFRRDFPGERAEVFLSIHSTYYLGSISDFVISVGQVLAANGALLAAVKAENSGINSLAKTLNPKPRVQWGNELELYCDSSFTLVERREISTVLTFSADEFAALEGGSLDTESELIEFLEFASHLGREDFAPEGIQGVLRMAKFWKRDRRIEIPIIDVVYYFRKGKGHASH